MTEAAESAKVKLATVWLDGCSGCHMSFLDMDERLLELSAKFDLVFSPIVDFKSLPGFRRCRPCRGRDQQR